MTSLLFIPPLKNLASTFLTASNSNLEINSSIFNFLFFTSLIKISPTALRLSSELKSLRKKISYKEVLKSIKKRDKSDYERTISPLKKTKDSILINTSNLTKRSCFLKIKKIIDKKIKLNGNL